MVCNKFLRYRLDLLTINNDIKENPLFIQSFLFLLNPKNCILLCQNTFLVFVETDSSFGYLWDISTTNKSYHIDLSINNIRYLETKNILTATHSQWTQYITPNGGPKSGCHVSSSSYRLSENLHSEMKNRKVLQSIINSKVYIYHFYTSYYLKFIIWP